MTRGATPHPPCFADASPSAQDERDALLYHILTQQPGLVIVFVNAISALRRLLSLLKILQLPVEGLHGNMQQRARLKYLDRFRAAALSEGTNESSAASVGSGPAGGGEKKRTSVLVATDVAARGIDIKGVDLVVHYQVPTSADTYVHRSGRTGRARNEGASVVLVTPGERTRYRALLRALKRDGPLPAFPTVETAVAEARRRLSLAKRLDKIAHARQRDAADAEWRPANAPGSASSLTRTRTRTRTPCWCSTPRTKAKTRWRRRRTGRSRGRGAGGAARRPRRGGEILRVRVGLGLGGIRRPRTASWCCGVQPGRPASAARLGEHGRLNPGRSKLRGDLAELLNAPRRQAEPRAGVAARVISQGGPGANGARVAREERHTRVARRARDGRHEGCVRGGHAEGGGEGCRARRRGAGRRRREKTKTRQGRPWRHPVTFFFKRRRDAAYAERRAPLPEGYRLLGITRRHYVILGHVIYPPRTLLECGALVSRWWWY